MTLKFDIHTDDAVPVGGCSQVVLRPNGSFTFSGHLALVIEGEHDPITAIVIAVGRVAQVYSAGNGDQAGAWVSARYSSNSSDT